MAHLLAQDVVKDSESMVAQSPIGDSGSHLSITTGHTGPYSDTLSNFSQSPNDINHSQSQPQQQQPQIQSQASVSAPTQSHAQSHLNTDRYNHPSSSLPERELAKSPLSAVQADASGGSDTDNSKADGMSRKENALSHTRSNSVKKPPIAFKSVNVTKNFLAKTALGSAPASRGAEKITSGPTAAAVIQSSRPRLVAKSTIGASSSKPGITFGRSSQGSDPSQVWNRIKPNPLPIAKTFTDEELKQQYGIHLASRIATSEGAKDSKWADLEDDEDDWAPQPVQWVESSKSTTSTPTLANATVRSSADKAQLTPNAMQRPTFNQQSQVPKVSESKADTAVKPQPTSSVYNQSQSQSQNQSQNGNRTQTQTQMPTQAQVQAQVQAQAQTPDQALHSVVPTPTITKPYSISSSTSSKTILRPGIYATNQSSSKLNGISDKSASASKTVAPAPLPAKSPWQPLPPVVGQLNPITFNPSIPEPAPEPQPVAEPNLPRSTKQIAADDFNRDLDGEPHGQKILYNSQSGLMESVNNTRHASRRDSNSRHQPAPAPAAVLQRQQANSRSNGLEPWQPRHRGTSFSKTGRRMSNNTSGPFGRTVVSKDQPQIQNQTQFSKPSSTTSSVVPDEGVREDHTNTGTIYTEDAVIRQQNFRRENIEQARIAKQKKREDEERENQARMERLRRKMEVLAGATKSDTNKDDEKGDTVQPTIATNNNITSLAAPPIQESSSSPTKDVKQVQVTMPSPAPPKPPVPRFEGEVAQYGMIKVHQAQPLRHSSIDTMNNASQSSGQLQHHQSQHQQRQQQRQQTNKYATMNQSSKNAIDTKNLNYDQQQPFHSGSIYQTSPQQRHMDHQSSKHSQQHHHNQQQQQHNSNHPVKQHISSRRIEQHAEELSPPYSSSWRSPFSDNNLINGWSTSTPGNVWAPPQSKEKPLGNGTFESGGFASHGGGSQSNSANSNSTPPVAALSTHSNSPHAKTPGPIAPPPSINNNNNSNSIMTATHINQNNTNNHNHQLNNHHNNNHNKSNFDYLPSNAHSTQNSALASATSTDLLSQSQSQSQSHPRSHHFHSHSQSSSQKHPSTTSTLTLNGHSSSSTTALTASPVATSSQTLHQVHSLFPLSSSVDQDKLTKMAVSVQLPRSQDTSATAENRNAQLSAAPGSRSTLADWQALPTQLMLDEKQQQEAFMARARQVHGFTDPLPSAANRANAATNTLTTSKAVFHETFIRTAPNAKLGGPSIVLSTTKIINAPTPDVADQDKKQKVAGEPSQSRSSRFFPSPSAEKSQKSQATTNATAAVTPVTTVSPSEKKLGSPPPPEVSSFELVDTSDKNVVVHLPKIAVVKLPPSVTSASVQQSKPTKSSSDWQNRINSLLKSDAKTNGNSQASVDSFSKVPYDVANTVNAATNSTKKTNVVLPALSVSVTEYTSKPMDDELFPQPEFASTPTIDFPDAQYHQNKEIAYNKEGSTYSRYAAITESQAISDVERSFAVIKPIFGSVDQYYGSKVDITVHLGGMSEPKVVTMPVQASKRWIYNHRGANTNNTVKRVRTQNTHNFAHNNSNNHSTYNKGRKPTGGFANHQKDTRRAASSFYRGSSRPQHNSGFAARHVSSSVTRV